MPEATYTTIGRNVRIDLIGYTKQVPAKVDTGADSSSVFASNIKMLTDNTLQFTLFGPSSSFYTGELIQTRKYTVAFVRSATGHTEIRYRVPLSVRIKGKRIKVIFNLSDRSKNNFPILIGRRTLNKKFIVDVTQADDRSKQVTSKTSSLNKELQKDPVAFYKKYHGQDL